MQELREQDQKTGLWVIDYPYKLSTALGDSFQRKYLLPDVELTVHNDRGFPQLFQTLTQQEVLQQPLYNLYFMNGRTFYFVHQRLPPSPCLGSFNLQPIEETRYNMRPMYQLICSLFRVPDYNTFFEDDTQNLCTDIGSKIAKSLIKIASQRIFAEPEQSIMELPVNSLDSYIGGDGSQVGKFGMGFFSILYWLVGNEERTLTIESFHRGRKFVCVLQEVNDQLSFSLKHGTTNVQQSGTRVVLDCSLKPFTDHNVQLFQTQMARLRFTTSSLIAFRTSKTAPFVRLNQADVNNPNVVYTEVTPHGIVVEDFAEGISLDILLNKLFVPSVSTKTISMSVQQERFCTGVDLNCSRITPVEAELNSISFLVHAVAVISLPFKSLSKTKYNVILFLSGHTRVPVSRDDVLMTRKTKEELEAIVRKLVTEDCMRHKNVAALQLGLQAYEQYTTLSENKKFIMQLRQIVKESLGEKIQVGEMYAELLTQPAIDVEGRMIVANETDSRALITYLDENVPHDALVFWEKKVVITDHVPNLYTNAGLAKYMFIDRQLVESYPTDWKSRVALSCYMDKLYITEERKLDAGEVDMSQHFNTKYRTYVEDKYRKMIEEDAPIQIVNLLCQIILKLIVLLEMYKTNKDELLRDNFTTKENGSGYIILNAFLEKCRNYEEEKELQCWIDNLIAINVVSEQLALRYYYAFYNFLTQFLMDKPVVVYGSSRIIEVNNKLVIGMTDNYYSFYFLYNGTHLITKSTVQMLLRTFPQLRDMIEESVELSLKAFRSNQTLSLWCNLNPLYLVYKSFVISDVNLSQNYPTSRYVYSHYKISSFFVLYLLKNFKDMSFLEFWVVTALVEQLESKMDDSKLFQESPPNEQMFLLVLQFTREFVLNNITDLETFVKTCMIELNRFTQLNFYNNVLPETLKKKLILAFDIFINSLKNIPFLPKLKTNELPLASSAFVFTESKLINFVLKQDFSKENLFEAVSRFQDSNPIPLQMTEIAINEGSTKSFVEALLIETIQNSVDAIREKFANATAAASASVRNFSRIELFLYDMGDSLVFRITDYIGIPSNSVLSLMIPFLSSKTASQFVTGEMGSGFFNLYRESSQVIVHTTVDGHSLTVQDTPVRNEFDRVVELERAVQEKEEARANQTDIYVVMKKDIHFNMVVTNFVFFIRGVIALIPQLQHAHTHTVDIYFQGQPLNMVTEAILETPLFTSKLVTEALVPSYLYTKGVPFLTLTQFVINAGLAPEYALLYLDSNIIVNVQHGVYTPVQTRAKINMSLANRQAMTVFIEKTLYKATLLSISRGLVALADSYLENFSSTTSLNQLLSYEINGVTLETAGKFNRFMMYFQMDGLKSFATLINEAYGIMGLTEFKKLSAAKQAAIRALSIEAWQSEALVQWLITKNQEPPPTRSVSPKASRLLNDEQVRKLTVVFSNFVTEFWHGTHQLGLFQNLRSTPRLFIKRKDSAIQGYYTPQDHKIVINENAIGMTASSVNEFLNWFENVRSANRVQELDDNPLYNKFLKHSLPARTLIHELEHARQGDSHNSSAAPSASSTGQSTSKRTALQGAHGEVKLQFPGEPERIYIFDVAAATIYQHLLQNGLWTRVLEALPQSL